jgi:hypothetical protein
MPNMGHIGMRLGLMKKIGLMYVTGSFDMRKHLTPISHPNMLRCNYRKSRFVSCQKGQPISWEAKMALPIKATPKLSVKESEVFLQKLQKDENKTAKYTETPRIDVAERLLLVHGKPCMK